MKKLLTIALFFISVTTVYAVESQSLWSLSGGSVKTNSNSWPVQVGELGNSGTKCLHTDNNGVISTSTADCGTGGSSGSSTIVYAGNGITVNASGTNGYVVVNNGVTSTVGNWVGTWQGFNHGDFLPSSTVYLVFYNVNSTNPFISVVTTTNSAALTFSSSSLNLGSASTHPASDFLPATTTYVASFNGATGTITGVNSVNAATGTVTITSSSLGVYTNTSQLTNGAGFISNISTTINTAAPLGGGGSLANNGTLNLTCAGCLTSAVTSVTGTVNQVIVSGNTGAVTLSLPQSIATSSPVQFSNVTTTNEQLSGTASDTAINVNNLTLQAILTIPTTSVSISGGGGGLTILGSDYAGIINGNLATTTPFTIGWLPAFNSRPSCEFDVLVGTQRQFTGSNYSATGTTETPTNALSASSTIGWICLPVPN